MFTRLVLIVTGALLATVSAQRQYQCKNVTAGILIGSGVETYNFELPEYIDTFSTSLPHRIGVLINGVEVMVCGNDVSPFVAADYYSVNITRTADGASWIPIDIHITRRYSTLSSQGVFRLM